MIRVHGFKNDSSERKKSLVMSLNPEELPGRGWAMLGERIYRSGSIGPDGDRAKRSRQAGGVAVWRSFELDAPHRGLWSQVAPYASADDAESAVPILLSIAEKNPSFVGRVVEERKNDELTIANVNHLYAVERITVENRGGAGGTKYVVGSIDRIIFVVACSQYGDGWEWSEVASVAELQARKIFEASFSKGS
jgi:hypothetical protein